jgi:hypothetical protein
MRKRTTRRITKSESERTRGLHLRGETIRTLTKDDLTGVVSGCPDYSDPGGTTTRTRNPDTVEG